MQEYKDFRPTSFDHKGAFLADNRNWLVIPVMQTRNSGPLDRSNFEVALAMLGGENDNIQVHRFEHWGPGWFEIIIIDPANVELVKIAEGIETALADYLVLDENDFSAKEYAAALEIWQNCYNAQARIEYIRKHRNYFEFRDYLTLISNIRGNSFDGYASELVG
jgi:hypothetical protein